MYLYIYIYIPVSGYPNKMRNHPCHPHLTLRDWAHTEALSVGLGPWIYSFHWEFNLLTLHPAQIWLEAKHPGPESKRRYAWLSLTWWMGCLMLKWLRGDHFGLGGNRYGASPPANLFRALPEFTAEHWAEMFLNMIYQQHQKSPWGVH